MPATTRSQETEDPTIKGLQWKLLYGNHRAELDEQGWPELARATGAPEDVKALGLEQDVPLAPFNQALSYLDDHLGQGDGATVHRIAVQSVERWAAMYQTLVDELEGRPVPMLELFCTEVYPWLTSQPGSAQVLAKGQHEAVVRVTGPLDPAFREGLVEGFVAITGATPTVEALDGDRFHVRWRGVESQRPQGIALFLKATRARFLAATLAPLALGTALAWWQATVDPVLVALSAVAAVSLHLSANAFNDVVDHLAGVDPANLTPTPFSGGSRTIQIGLLGWRGMVALAGALGAVGIAVGLGLVAMSGPWVLSLGLVGVLLGYAYSGTPFKLSHRGLGEATVALVFGPLVTAGAFALQTGTAPPEAWLAGLPVGLLMAAVVYAGALPDAPWDARTGKATLAVRLGERAPLGLWALLGLAFGSVIGLSITGVLPLWCLIALAGLPLAWIAGRGIEATWQDAQAVVRHQARVLYLHGQVGLLLVAGVALEVLA